MPTLDPVIRVSRRNGRSGDSFLSPDEQMAAIEKYARTHRIRLGVTHDETDSVSGGKVIDRPGLGDALRRALNDESDGIIVAKLDRYARNLREGLEVIERIEQAGKVVHSAAEGKSAGPGMSPQAQFMRNVMLSVAEMERARLAAGLDYARQDAIARGVHGHAPFGYERGADRHLVPRAGEAEWVQRIFEARAAGKSWTAIADWLNAEGVTPRRAAGFTHKRIARIVASRTYLGEAHSGEYVMPDAHVALVSPALWDAANGQRRTAARRDRESFLLAGLIRCASCGVRMMGLNDHKRLADGSTKVYSYYRCRRNHSFGKCVAPTKVRADEIEPIVEAFFRELYLSDRRLDATQDVSIERAEATVARDAAKDELSSYVRVTSALDADVFQAGLDVRQDALRAAQDRLSEAEAAEMGVSYPADLNEQWPGLSTEDRRGFLSDGIAAVAVAPGRGPVADRAAVWALHDSAAPALLPGVRGHGEITPLCVPTGAGVQAS